jgi:Zn-dependent protease
LGGINSINIAIAVIWIVLFLLISGPVHECAHAFVAWKKGDGTAKLFGRITLNPFVHFDPVGGTLLAVSVLFGALSGSPIGFGWAKPTPVNPGNLRGRFADSLVAVSGPLSNLVLAAVFAVGFRVMYGAGHVPWNDNVPDLITLVFWVGINLNVVLMLFNLIPIPPLDGSHVLMELVGPRTAWELRMFFNQYGVVIIVLVILLAGRIIGPLLDPIVSFLAGV